MEQEREQFRLLGLENEQLVETVGRSRAELQHHHKMVHASSTLTLANTTTFSTRHYNHDHHYHFHYNHNIYTN
jgi:hypothetical protein